MGISTTGTTFSKCNKENNLLVEIWAALRNDLENVLQSNKISIALTDMTTNHTRYLSLVSLYAPLLIVGVVINGLFRSYCPLPGPTNSQEKLSSLGTEAHSWKANV
ncbi:unnamed protein product [Gordionus sp. m RMFG-2023]